MGSIRASQDSTRVHFSLECVVLNTRSSTLVRDIKSGQREEPAP